MEHHRPFANTITILQCFEIGLTSDYTGESIFPTHMVVRINVMAKKDTGGQTTFDFIKNKIRGQKTQIRYHNRHGIEETADVVDIHYTPTPENYDQLTFFIALTPEQIMAMENPIIDSYDFGY